MNKFSKNQSDNLLDFLRNRRVGKKHTHTHTCMFPHKMSLYIDDNELEELYKLYYEHVFVHNNQIGLTERNKQYTSIKIDLDFKYNEEGHIVIRKYNLEDIKQIISYYMEIIEEWLCINDEDRLCFVMEKKAPRKVKSIIKDGIHIIFPRIITDTKLQFVFREFVLTKIDNVIQKYDLINTKEDVVDIQVIEKNPWLMYGSVKHGDLDSSYMVSNVFKAYKDINKIKKLENPYTNEALVRILSIRTNLDESMLKQDKEAEFVKIYEDINLKYNSTKKNEKKSPKIIKKLSNEELENIKMYIDCLSVDRATSYETWMNVGWAIHNLGNNPELLEYWIEFSKKAPNYKHEADHVCRIAWEKMDYGNCGLGSIRHWAKQDNPEQVKNIGYENSKKNILKSLDVSITGKKSLDDEIRKQLNISSENVAQVLYDNFGDDYIMVGKRGKGTYYQYSNHKWIEMDGHLLLREKIRTEIKQDYERYIHDIFTNPTEEQKEIQDKIDDAKKLGNVMKSLGSTNFKNQVMEEAKEFFYDRNQTFLSNLDSNPKLLGFSNGVYDLVSGTFREGYPEDNISMSTRIEYKEYEENDELVLQVNEFLEQILPDRPVREYVLTVLGSFLDGENPDERFHIWTGSGGNGKSKLLELFEMSFGDYSCKLPITLLTTKRKGSNEAQPELARTKGKRSAILQEPDEHTRLNVGLMKEMTGGDTIIARNLYEQPIEFKPQIKMILICNHLPELPYDDEATWRRVRSVEFKSKFVDEDQWDKNDRYQFLKDGDLSQNFKNWKEPFMWILLQYYRKWTIEGLYEPPDVTECTQKYKSQNDHFAEFFQNYLIKIDDESQCLGIRQIYKQYKEVAFHNSETPKKLKELQKYLEKRISPMTGNGNLRGWKGWTLKQLDAEVVGDINSDNDSEFEVISSN